MTLGKFRAAPTVVITGANGFIGSHLVRRFNSLGWRVIAMCRAVPRVDPEAGVSYRPFSLPDGFRTEDLEGGDYLVHCACARYSRHCPNSDEINIRGTRLLLDASRRLRFRKFVFLSSLAAHEHAQSHYGRHKFALERIFDPQRDVVLRPGLTLGSGGLVQSIARAIQRVRVVPLVGGGNQRLYTVSVDEVSSAIEMLLEQGVSGQYVLAAREPVTMRAFYESIARRLGVRCVFLPLPFYPVYLTMRAVESLGVDLPVTTENLLGLMQLRTIDTSTDLRVPGMQPMPFEDTVRSLALS